MNDPFEVSAGAGSTSDLTAKALRDKGIPIPIGVPDDAILKRMAFGYADGRNVPETIRHAMGSELGTDSLEVDPKHAGRMDDGAHRAVDDPPPCNPNASKVP